MTTIQFPQTAPPPKPPPLQPLTEQKDTGRPSRWSQEEKNIPQGIPTYVKWDNCTPDIMKAFLSKEKKDLIIYAVKGQTTITPTQLEKEEE